MFCRATIAAASALVVSAVTGTVVTEQTNLAPAPARPRCSSILHLFGPWLFEAAFIGSEFAKHFASAEAGGSGGPGRRAEPGLSPRPAPLPGQAASLGSESLDLPPALTPDR